MTVVKRSFQYRPDQFHHELSTKLGNIYARFLLKLFLITVKGKVKNLPTVNLDKNPLETDTEPLDKTIVDTLYELLTKAAGEPAYRKTVLHVEHQHRNHKELHIRMGKYYIMLCGKYKKREITQILVYTGDNKFNSPTTLKSRINTNRYHIVDLTQIDPTDMMNDPHFGIQLLCIFNHKLKKEEKVRFLVERFKAFYKAYGREETQFYLHLLALAMTKRNASAIKAITAELSFDAEFEEMIKQTPYYQKGNKEGKVSTAVEIIKSGLVSLEALTQTLRLTPEEIAAIQAILQQSSNGNGNGSNGAHQ